MGDLWIAIGAGEFLDRLTILEIKSERFESGERRQRVFQQLLIMKNIFHQKKLFLSGDLYRKLKKTNEELWDIEEHLRVLEKEENFGSQFIFLARKVYLTNDRRFQLKQEIDRVFSSKMREEKEYSTWIKTA